jgi:hypothetical protein
MIAARPHLCFGRACFCRISWFINEFFLLLARSAHTLEVQAGAYLFIISAGDEFQMTPNGRW